MIGSLFYVIPSCEGLRSWDFCLLSLLGEFLRDHTFFNQTEELIGAFFRLRALCLNYKLQAHTSSPFHGHLGPTGLQGQPWGATPPFCLSLPGVWEAFLHSVFLSLTWRKADLPLSSLSSMQLPLHTVGALTALPLFEGISVHVGLKLLIQKHNSSLSFDLKLREVCHLGGELQSHGTSAQTSQIASFH